MEGLGQLTCCFLLRPLCSPHPLRLPRPHLQLFGAVAQQHQLWVRPREVFHYKVVTGKLRWVVVGQAGAPRALLM